MSAASNDPSARKGGARQLVDRELLDAARLRLCRTNGGEWTACAATRRLVVLDAGAGRRACEHGRGPAPTDLDSQLAAGALPLPHCGGCADWLADELFATAPALADLGPADAAGAIVVVVLPAAAPALPARLLAELDAALPQARAVVLATEAPIDAEGPAVVLERVRRLAPAAPLTLRTGDRTTLRSATAAGLQLARLEWRATDADAAALAAVGAAASACKAQAAVRFVLTPAAWHQLEPLAHACAAARLSLEPCVLDRGGAAPLAALAAADLELIKDVLGSAWRRLDGPDRPTSLAEGAFDQVCRQLRALLRRALADGAAAATAAPLAFPGDGHPWCDDPALWPWWANVLLQHGDHPTVRAWLAARVAAPDAAALARRHVWLRVLLHREVAYGRSDAGRDLLKRLYGDADERASLMRADAAFAAEVDLTPYAGPWAARVGLATVRKRKRPFTSGRPTAGRKGEPRVTVLIPSYRHEAYVGEAIRSALAQRGVAVRVLVADDHSPDGTVAAARAIADPRVEVRVNDANVGLGNSTLQALAAVTTPYVALLNSDDLFHPDRLARCLAELDGDASAQLVATGMFLVDRDGGGLDGENVSLVLDGQLIHDWVNWFARSMPADEAARADLFGELLERNFLVTSSNLVARTDWLRGKAAILTGLKYCLDWRLFLAAAAEGSLRRIAEPLLAYRLHEANTVWFDADRRWSYYLEVHRVAAEALAEAAASPRADLAALVRDVAVHCAANTEVDGYGLLLHRLVDALRLDAAADDDESVRALIRTLDARRRPVAAAAPDDRRRAIAALDAEQRQSEYYDRRWLQVYCASLEKRLAAAVAERDRLQSEVAARTAAQARAEADVAEGKRRAEDLARPVASMAQELAALRTALTAVDALHHLVTDELAGVRRQRDEAQQKAEVEAAKAKSAEGRLETQLARAEKAEGERDGQQRRAERAEVDREGQRRRAELAETDRDGQRHRAEQAESEREAQRRRAESAEGERDAQRHRADHAEAERDLQHTRADLAEVDRDAQRHRADHGEAERELQRTRADQAEGDRDAQRHRADHGEAEREFQRTRADHAEADRDAQRHRADHGEAERELQRTRADHAEADRDAQRHRADHGEAERELQRTRADHAEADRDAQRHRADHAEAERELQRTRADHTEAERELQRTRAEAAEALGRSLAGELQAVRDQERRLAAELAAERANHAAAAQQTQALETQRNRLLEDLVRTDAERARLQGSREWRFGNFVWNKMPLGYMSRRGKKWLRRLTDLKDRALMRLRRRAEGVAVVAACWEWPIYSHTFVYQEMIGLTHMGLDVQMFHWKLGDLGQLHKAFGYLADHRTLLQPVWENHLRDKEHFEKTKPGRLRAFLEIVSQRTGRAAEELEKEPLVLQGCTFARMAELAGAKYLHSYFFYDQSFMVMQAAWLLEIPRGVSCYADHMLDDYPFKLVGLQVELADVVVATSARIKRELSAKSGGAHDDKIIVKPNGVDGGRFPAVDRAPRKPGDRFEAISISRIEPKKGLTFLVEAVADLTQRGHDVVVHVVGSKDVHSKGSLEYAEGFERLIADLGMQDRVILHGMKKQEELAPLLQRSRAFVAPYVEVANGDKDGIPTAMLEGLASGLPVVTTDSGSILEVVDDGVEGIVVAQRDAKGLADAFERLITDPALERRMAKAARGRFDREFDIRVTERRLHERVAALVRAVDKAK
jgi:colanic acid/amylovoran biosynthesis glycosyltransferase